MAKSRKNPAISQKNNSTSINNRRGKAKRAKRNASKKERQTLKKEIPPVVEVNETPWMEYEEQAFCPDCGAPHDLVRPGKTQPSCICHLICDNCGGRIAHHMVGEDSRYPRMGGEWCPKCGPFPDLEV